MSSEPEDGVGDRAPYEYTPEQLRSMDDEEARETLTVDQFERRAKIIDLHDGADEQQAEWAAEDERVTDLVVHADPESLGTSLELYGNEIIVHVDSDDDEMRAVLETIQEEYGDLGAEEAMDLPAEDREAIASDFMQVLDLVLMQWNGTDWDGLPDPERQAVLETCREKWGLDGLMLAWVEIGTAVTEDREGRIEAVESFRGA